MSRSENGKSWAFKLFLFGVFACVVGVVLTIASIWLSGGHHHGLGGKLAGTAAVFYIMGIVSILTGGANNWDWS